MTARAPTPGHGPQGPRLRLVSAGRPPPEPPLDPRPVIRVEKGHGHRHVLETIDALRDDPGLYQRRGSLVHIVGAPEPAEGREALFAPGSPIVRPVVLPHLWERASAAARWEREDRRRKDPWVPSDPPPPILSAVLARGDYPGHRELCGVLESPALRPDGLLAWSGYDELTGFVVCPRETFDPPPLEPTPEQGAAALQELREPFEQFPHVSEASRMVPVALILSALARPAILGACPAFGFDANTRGSGKTRQVDVATTIAIGRVAPPMNYPSEDEELEKIMGAIALAAPAVAKFDNVTVRFGGGPIDRVLTARDSTTFRILGRSEMPELPWRTLLAYTGNNLELRGDTARRSLLSRIASPHENPEEIPEAAFKHPDLVEWVARERVRLVRAGLTVLRAWVCAGRPRMTEAGCKLWGGGFESWSTIVPPAIVFCGGADPMLSRPALTGEEEPEKAAIGAILSGLERLDVNGAGLSMRAIVDVLWSRERLRGEAPPDGYDEMREALETIAPMRPGTAPSAKTLAERLRHLGRDRVVGGRRLVITKGHGNTGRYRSEKTP